MFGEEKKYIQGFWWAKFRERNHLEDPDIGGRKILKWNFRK
jgi:hypothetical protein